MNRNIFTLMTVMALLLFTKAISQNTPAQIPEMKIGVEGVVPKSFYKTYYLEPENFFLKAFSENRSEPLYLNSLAIISNTDIFNFQKRMLTFFIGEEMGLAEFNHKTVNVLASKSNSYFTATLPQYTNNGMTVGSMPEIKYTEESIPLEILSSLIKYNYPKIIGVTQVLDNRSYNFTYFAKDRPTNLSQYNHGPLIK